MYKKAIYKYSQYCGTITDKEKVIADFMEDIKTKPTNVTENKTRVFVWFRDFKYLTMYTMPIEYKKYINTEV
jgi:hypothetical protein